jgi:methionine-rich copper-binding protein CopC
MPGGPADADRRAPVDSRSVDTRRIDRHAVTHRPGRAGHRWLLAFVTGALLALAAVAPALGHAELVSSDPEDKAVLAAPPAVIALTFDEGLVGRSAFKLLGPDGATIATGAPAATGDETMTLDGLTLAPGAYTIEWTSVADDGDIERGTLTFTVSDPTPAPATPTPAPSQASSAPSPTASPAPSGTPAPSPSADASPVSSTGTDVLLPILAALALVAVAGAFLLRRNRSV